MKYLIVLALFLLMACGSSMEETGHDRFAQITDPDARSILAAAIDHAGGLERWDSIKRLRYTKDFSLLFASGDTERSYSQIHDYRYDPVLLDIVSIENGDTIRTVLENGSYSRTVNDSLITMDQSTLEQAVNTSTYVVSMPFKLLEPGTELKYLGEKELEDGRMVDVLEVGYGSDSDTWRYYFDRPERKIVANWVQTSDHYSLVENLTFERVGGILFNKERKSYRVDSLGNKLYLRAEYLYDNYQVE